jgi:hypothetical protein|tara:strand:- start:597 stop:1016 length:420 start_codon:yes stop_codon:yes gene_type:complete
LAYNYYIDTQVNCIFLKQSGEYELGEGLLSLDNILDDPKFLPNLNLLRDLREVSIPEQYNDIVELKKMRAKMDDYNKYFQHSLFAWVVGSATDFALAHRFCATTRLDGYATRRPFRELLKALEWLSIPDDYEIEYPLND